MTYSPSQRSTGLLPSTRMLSLVHQATGTDGKNRMQPEPDYDHQRIGELAGFRLTRSRTIRVRF